MKIEIKLDPNVKEPEIIIIADRMTDEISDLAKRLSGDAPQLMTGSKDGTHIILEPKEISRVFSLGGKTYAVTGSGEYIIRQRLYEAEETLEKHGFVRISNSEIINLKKVKGFDLSFTGTICVKMTDGTETYASRRYVSRIKQVLGL